jgi:hypothetical protein
VSEQEFDQQGFHQKPALPWRIAVSMLWGVATGAFCFFLQWTLHQGAGDFTWAIHLAQRMLAGQNLYDTPFEQYPLTAALFAVPFVGLRPEMAAAVFYGLGSGLLAFALTRNSYHRLLVFLAYPYWVGLITVQWSTIIAASAFFPVLAAVAMAKPQVGLPVFLTHFNRRSFWSCVVVGVLSLIVMPRWPKLWMGQMGYYEHFFAILVIPGPLILLALLRYRDRDAWLLLLNSIMPQRWFFDAFTLWLIPKSRWELIVTVVFSWCSGIWRWYHQPTNIYQVGRWIVLSIYLPMLVIVLLRRSNGWEADETDNKTG